MNAQQLLFLSLCILSSSMSLAMYNEEHPQITLPKPKNKAFLPRQLPTTTFIQSEFNDLDMQYYTDIREELNKLTITISTDGEWYFIDMQPIEQRIQEKSKLQIEKNAQKQKQIQECIKEMRAKLEKLSIWNKNPKMVFALGMLTGFAVCGAALYHAMVGIDSLAKMP